MTGLSDKKVHYILIWDILVFPVQLILRVAL